MENHPTEGDPLKREDGAEGGAPTTEIKKGCKELDFAKLTHWRTAVFFFSLFLCLTVVFAFSFIIPCPVRPQYLISWHRTFNDTATYDFLAIEDANKDKVMDVLFVVRSSEVSQNKTCAGKGLPSPCVFVVAVDGTDGKTLWETPLEPAFHWAQCGLKEDGNRSWDCLVSHSDKLTAIEKDKGVAKWQQVQPVGQPGSVPVLSLPDLDGDKVGDVALMIHDSESTKVSFLSGESGQQIGSTVPLDAVKALDHIFYRTKGGSHYILLERDSGLFGLSLWGVAAKAKAGLEDALTKDKHWESKANATTGLVLVFKSDQVRQVLKTAHTDSSNLLLVTKTEVVQVSGRLDTLWMYNSSSIIGTPSFGHFNKDGVLDVVIEEDVGNDTKKVIILDGVSGGVLWAVSLQNSPNSPRPASIHTTNSFSVFMFWGLFLMDSNSSVPQMPVESTRRAYMLHPLYSNVLLESANLVDHIITFRATLLEHGRHAAYFTLTGPGAAGAEGTVILSKRKLKQDVPDSRVVPISSAGAAETNGNIKEAFNRLRFSDE
ncbi:unnamed protein product [Knipowitschia caucasica]|uniref:FAM234A/B beta-propeller domain-containing protein n=1 Tax=Knipowitschia caucasica TaxID=637954 RepID=A0AAV2L9Z5_KNICA